MSDTSSEGDLLDLDLANIMHEAGMLQGFSFEPRREDHPELWEQEWGSDRSDSDDSSGSASGASDGSHSNRRGNTDWCQCSNCVPMPTESESQCCIEIQTVYNRFNKDGHECK